MDFGMRALLMGRNNLCMLIERVIDGVVELWNPLAARSAGKVRNYPKGFSEDRNLEH
jgi:hypothetical protein